MRLSRSQAQQVGRAVDPMLRYLYRLPERAAGDAVADVVCRPRLGGLLRHYERAA